jgi:hypothetical protein
MIRALLILTLLAFAAPASAQTKNSPPVGNSMPVQPAKTGNYTVTQRDLRTIIPMNCASGCTVTMPQSTSSFPKGYPVIIQNIGAAGAVTVTATTSTLYGVPLTSGNILLAQCGDYVLVTADSSNNYLASGELSASGSCGGGVILLTGGGVTLTGGGIPLSE